MKVLFVLKIHCHLVQMTCVLSVKERCPWVCLYTDPYGGWVSEWRSISLTLLSVTARQYLRRANWALLSHSLGCHWWKGHGPSPSFQLILTLVSALLCTCKLELCGVSICAFLGVGKNTCGPVGPVCELWVLCLDAFALFATGKENLTTMMSKNKSRWRSQGEQWRDNSP